MEDQLRDLKAQKDGFTLSFGGYDFKNLEASRAWVQTIKELNLAKYCVDACMQLGALTSQYKTRQGIIKEEADARKAGYLSADAANTSASFDVAYPELIFKESNKPTDAATGGMVFVAAFLSADVFEGTIESSCKAKALSTLESNCKKHQAAIDARFPADQSTHSKTHAVLSAILRHGYFQAVGYLESLIPFNKMMTATGLVNEEAWKKCLTYSRAVFDWIHGVRSTSSDHDAGSMLHRMILATKLLEAYGELGWIRHPDVSFALVVASLQKEGKSMKSAIERTEAKNREIERNTATLKKLKNNNPDLNG